MARRLDYVLGVRISHEFRRALERMAEQLELTTCQLARAALAEVVGNTGQEYEADNESAPRLLATA